MKSAHGPMTFSHSGRTGFGLLACLGGFSPSAQVLTQQPKVFLGLVQALAAFVQQQVNVVFQGGVIQCLGQRLGVWFCFGLGQFLSTGFQQGQQVVHMGPQVGHVGTGKAHRVTQLLNHPLGQRVHQGLVFMVVTRGVASRI